MLTYPVQFEKHPVDAIDRVIDRIVNSDFRAATPEDYRAAIHEALAGSVQLSELIPQDHSEDVIRQYLAEVARRIEQASVR